MITPNKVLNSRPFDNTNLLSLVTNLSSSSLMQLQSCCYYFFSSKKLLIMKFIAQYDSLCQCRRLEPLSLKLGRWNLFVVICGHHRNREVVPAPSKWFRGLTFERTNEMLLLNIFRPCSWASLYYHLAKWHWKSHVTVCYIYTHTHRFAFIEKHWARNYYL